MVYYKILLFSLHFQIIWSVVCKKTIYSPCAQPQGSKMGVNQAFKKNNKLRDQRLEAGIAL